MYPLPRSTQTGRGELAGPAPVPRQVRRMGLIVEQVETGVWQLSTTFGHQLGQARNPAQLAHLVAAGFRESQLAAYARFRSGSPDEPSREGVSQYERPRPTRRGRRPDVHDPRAWQVDSEGRWVSPGSGRRFSAESQVVQRVQARLAAMWEPVPQNPSPENDWGY